MTEEMEAASAAQQQVRRDEERLARSRERRDEAVRAAVAAGSSMYAVAKRTGLSESHVGRICGTQTR
ncbi:hypothetical protein [Buchananella hordeovulneris]|uniref:hypothetical protein n=1 Tax=Buchananella hordeovulneris TaxID=52770 RepID=UPI000F5EE0B8|nr:hypothetical protein [Buchananella hordeovulneris]RRD41481.1 hypothetical protein EII13_11000 [Buchananella hordeovulneris]